MNAYDLTLHANVTYAKEEQHRSGFLPGCRPADNLFMSQALVQRQLVLGPNDVICLVDFDKAFDLVNHLMTFDEI